MAEGTDNRWADLPDRPTKLTAEELEVADDLLWAAMDPGLQDLYPDELVAVHRRQVVAHGHDRLTVMEEAQRITGLPKHRIAITTVLGPGLLWSPR